MKSTGLTNPPFISNRKRRRKKGLTKFSLIVSNCSNDYAFCLEVDPLVVNVAAVCHASIPRNVIETSVARLGFCIQCFECQRIAGHSGLCLPAKDVFYIVLY